MGGATFPNSVIHCTGSGVFARHMLDTALVVGLEKKLAQSWCMLAHAMGADPLLCKDVCSGVGKKALNKAHLDGFNEVGLHADIKPLLSHPTTGEFNSRAQLFADG
eukprot:6513088-Pyramimonas_sp.AAC.3